MLLSNLDVMASPGTANGSIAAAKRAEVVLPDAPLPRPAEAIDDEAIAATASILGAAERPIIVIGGGAIEAGAEVIRLAEMLEAPVSSNRRGRGVIPTMAASATSSASNRSATATAEPVGHDHDATNKGQFGVTQGRPIML